jgi:haloalkane dehalogenase
MHVMEVGHGYPVLMLHGNPTWGFLYRKVAGALSGAPARLIMPDIIGMGLSDKPSVPAVHTLEYHARKIAELIRGLELDRLVLVVQDWGGAMGALAMDGMLDRLRGMVVLNTVIGPPREGFRPTRFHRFARVPVVSDIAFYLLGFPQNMIFVAQGDKSSIRGDIAKAYRYPLRRLRDRVAPLALARMVPNSFEHPSIPPLRRCHEIFTGFTGPCEIVWGDRDPVLGGVRSWIEKLKPDARVTRTQAGHFLQEEVPIEIAAAIRRVVELASAGAGAPATRFARPSAREG